MTVITYASLIVGELVPKQIAFRDPEAVAVRVAPHIVLFSKISLPLVWLLDRSGKVLLWLLGHRGGAEEKVSEEEIRTLVVEAENAGVPRARRKGNDRGRHAPRRPSCWCRDDPTASLGFWKNATASPRQLFHWHQWLREIVAHRIAEPLILEVIGNRFRTPRLSAGHGVKRAINVLIARGGEGHLPFGVLEVDSPDAGQFDLAGANFLAGFAGFLGIAIERQQADARLRDALEHQAMLTREMSHGVKNSLASVVGLLRVQGRNAQSKGVQNALKDAASRITTIAQVHDDLWRSNQIGFVDIADFAGELCHKLQETSPGHNVSCKFGHIVISADKAIPLGLLSTSL